MKKNFVYYWERNGNRDEVLRAYGKKLASHEDRGSVLKSLYERMLANKDISLEEGTKKPRTYAEFVNASRAYARRNGVYGTLNNHKSRAGNGKTLPRDKDAIWSTPGLSEKVAELIRGGSLKKGPEALLKEANRAIFKPREKKILRMSNLMRRLDELVWTRDRLTLVARFAALGAPLDPLYKELEIIPQNLIDKKAKQLRGRSVKRVASNELIGAGVGRLVTEDEVNLSRAKPVALMSYRLENPFPVKVGNPDNCRLFVINGAHLGLEYNRIIDENVLRNMFREAARNGDDAIFLTGALLWVDAKKSSGFLTTHRALYSGLDFDPSVPHYNR